MFLDDAETVGSEEDFWSNTLFKKQQQQTRNMRESLISCDETDPYSVKNTMQKILVMRIYHQITRIIRYTQEMDKIENKLYETIDAALDNMDPGYISENTAACLSTLMTMQQKLQQSMIDSQKLLDPYLNMDTLSYIELPAEQVNANDPIHGQVLDQMSRQKLREGAQAALTAIRSEAEETEA